MGERDTHRDTQRHTERDTERGWMKDTVLERSWLVREGQVEKETLVRGEGQSIQGGVTKVS
jgi:hypothetical protein